MNETEYMKYATEKAKHLSDVMDTNIHEWKVWMLDEEEVSKDSDEEQHDEKLVLATVMSGEVSQTPYEIAQTIADDYGKTVTLTSDSFGGLGHEFVCWCYPQITHDEIVRHQS